MAKRLTDNEKRIFLSAMAKEWKICDEIDKKCMDSTDKVMLVPLVDAIVHKVVSSSLWKERKEQRVSK